MEGARAAALKLHSTRRDGTPATTSQTRLFDPDRVRHHRRAPGDRAGSGDAQDRECLHCGGPAISRISRGASWRGCHRREPIPGPHQRRPDLPGDARGDRRRKAADQLRDLHLRQGVGRRPVHRRSRGRGAARRAGRSRRRRDGLEQGAVRDGQASARCRRSSRPVRQAELVHARRTQLSHAPQDPRRRRRGSGSPAASASPITGSATRRTRNTGATRWCASTGRSCD